MIKHLKMKTSEKKEDRRAGGNRDARDRVHVSTEKSLTEAFDPLLLYRCYEVDERRFAFDENSEQGKPCPWDNHHVPGIITSRNSPFVYLNLLPILILCCLSYY